MKTSVPVRCVRFFPYSLYQRAGLRATLGLSSTSASAPLLQTINPFWAVPSAHEGFQDQKDSLTTSLLSTNKGRMGLVMASEVLPPSSRNPSVSPCLMVLIQAGEGFAENDGFGKNHGQTARNEIQSMPELSSTYTSRPPHGTVWSKS